MGARFGRVGGTLIALGASAALIAGCSSSGGKSATSTVTVTTGSSTTFSAAAAIPPLRPVADAYMRDSNAAARNTDQFLKVVPRYADPGCASLITSMVRAYGGLSADDEPTSFKSVTQTGATGVTVDQNGDSLHWNYANGKWLFTCDASSFEPIQDDTTTEQHPTETEQAPAYGQPCDSDGAISGNLRCTNVGSGHEMWTYFAPGATEGN